MFHNHKYSVLHKVVFISSFYYRNIVQQFFLVHNTETLRYLASSALRVMLGPYVSLDLKCRIALLVACSIIVCNGWLVISTITNILTENISHTKYFKEDSVNFGDFLRRRYSRNLPVGELV
jgi:hypothetical protein